MRVTGTTANKLNNFRGIPPTKLNTVMYRFSGLYQFSAQNAGNKAWSHHMSAISI